MDYSSVVAEPAVRITTESALNHFAPKTSIALATYGSETVVSFPARVSGTGLAPSEGAGSSDGSMWQVTETGFPANRIAASCIR